MTSTAPHPAYASPADTTRYGEYRINRTEGDTRPVYRFQNRITADGSSGFPAEAGRYHLYAGWFCPWSQRVTLELALNGLQDVISVSYVDGERDGRGWAFRERHGADPVNGFTLLRDAYELTEPGFDGHISVPTLWDRETGKVVSNDFVTLGIDLATQFDSWRTPGIDTYPAHLREEIEELDSWIGPKINKGVGPAAGTGPAADQARHDLLAAFTSLDEILADSTYLIDGGVTEADVRLFVTLIRYDVQSNLERRIGPPLSAYENLARYAARLYDLPAFRETTDLATFGAPGSLPSFVRNESVRNEFVRNEDVRSGSESHV